MADDDSMDGQDDHVVARVMVGRIDHAIELARAIGADHLAELLERARDAAQEEANAERSTSVH